MSNITYRAAGESDIPGIARLRAEQWGADKEEYWRNRIYRYMRGDVNPQQALPPRIVYVAVQDEVIIGFIAGHLTRRFGCDGELEWINVAAECRGTGTSFKLLQRLADWFVNQNASYICVNCAADNAVAQRFYKRHGAEAFNEHWLIWKDISAMPNK